MNETTQTEKTAEVQENVSKLKRSKGRLCLKIMGVSFALLIAGLIFLATGFGQRSVIKLADRFLDALSIEQIEGSLQEGLTLVNTQYKMSGVDVNVGQAKLQLGVDCLLKGEACVENVSLKDTVVAVDTALLPPSQEENKDTEPFTELNLPLGVAVNHIDLENVKVSVDEMDISLEQFHSGVKGKGRELTLLPTQLSGLNIALAPAKADEQAVKKAEEIVKQPIDWVAIENTLRSPFLPKNQPLVLPFDLDVQPLELTNIELVQKVKNEQGEMAKPISLFHLNSGGLEAKSDQQAVKLTRLFANSKQGNVEGHGELTLSENYPLNLTLKADKIQFEPALPVKQFEVLLTGELYQKTALTVNTQGAIQAELKGDIALSTENNPFNLTLTSPLVTYPFEPKKGEDPLKVEKVALTLNGSALDYHLTLNANAKGMNLPASQLDLKGKGGLTAFNIERLNLDALDGKTQLSGSVDWRDGVAWDSQLQLSQVNTKSLVPDWAAVLSGELQSKGYAARSEKGQSWAVEVPKIDLNGTLSQRPLKLQGQLNANEKNLLDVPNLQLVYGENKIDLQGSLNDKSQFKAEINAPNLQGLVPQLKAGVKGNVLLSGKMTEPNLDLDLVANNVSFDQLNLQQLTAKGKVTTEKQIQGDVDIGLQKLAYGEVKIDNAHLTAKGNEANHSLNLTAKGNPIGADLQLSGKFDRLQQVWTGQISQLVVSSKEFGQFKNNQAINVNYNNKQINAQVSAHCWNNPKLELCFPQAFNAGQEGKVPFEIKRFNLDMLQELLGKESILTGAVTAKGDAAWFKNKAPQVNLELQSPSLKFTQKMAEGKSFPITVSPLKINAKLAENNLNLNTDLRIENNGRLSTDLVMKDITKSRSLSGNINIDQISLKLIKPLLSGGESVDGNINAKLTMSGNVASPLLHGQLSVSELRAKSVSMPFDVTGGRLAMNFKGATSTLDGVIQTTESDLFLDGTADWRRLDAWKSTVHAKANRFKVNVPNMAKVEFSPDISVTATPKELILGGTIDIPWARIEVEELPESAVGVSDDEIIMDGSVKQKIPLSQRKIPQNTPSGMAIKADIKINIGNDVKLNAYGLKADLNGLINVRQGKQGLGLYGQVNIDKGRYASFGQDLLIRKGQISFAGLPSQPSLNIEAIRNPEAMEDSSVIAGVKVFGLADSPEVKVFSEPAMSQNNALSYILTGRSLESSGDASSSNSMAAALLSMSLSKSSKAVGAVGSAFGLNDLSVTTAGIGDNTKVEVSTSLTQKFRVKYGVGIFAPLTELTLRYNLAPKLYLQWVSSVNQAVDLMYRFEFD